MILVEWVSISRVLVKERGVSLILTAAGVWRNMILQSNELGPLILGIVRFFCGVKLTLPAGGTSESLCSS